MVCVGAGHWASFDIVFCWIGAGLRGGDRGSQRDSGVCEKSLTSPQFQWLTDCSMDDLQFFLNDELVENQTPV